MEVESVMVTGANRGIGLEFVKQLVQLPRPPRFVFATYRNRDTIQTLEEIRDASKETHVLLIKMDVTMADEREGARKIVEDTVGGKGLNLLINNAGTLERQCFSEITEQNMLFHFNTNAMGPVMLVKELLPLLQKSAAYGTEGMGVSKAAVLNISSEGGSITLLTDEIPKQWVQIMGYRISKTALNMAMRVVSLTVKDEGILVANMCPGWVKTDMGSRQATLEASESVSAMMKTLSRLNESHHGTFLDRNGEAMSF